jgi:D-aminoacyl-tRNA deacylase
MVKGMVNFGNIAVVVSSRDPAGMNIRQNLIENCGFEPNDENFEGEPVYELNATRLFTTERETIHSDHLDSALKADLIIFATKHQSSQGVNSLSVHVPGNWGTAEMGGRDRGLCIAPASYIKSGLRILQELAEDTHFEVTVEQTHHGPLLKTPCFFIEIGSNEEQWKDPEAGKIVSLTVSRLIDQRESFPAAVLLGGGHYNHEANKILLGSKYSIGHICAKHSLPDLDDRMLRRAIECTFEEVELVILDWKGLGSEKKKIVDILEKRKIPFERSKKIEK